MVSASKGDISLKSFKEDLDKEVADVAKEAYKECEFLLRRNGCDRRFRGEWQFRKEVFLAMAGYCAFKYLDFIFKMWWLFKCDMFRQIITFRFFRHTRTSIFEGSGQGWIALAFWIFCFMCCPGSKIVSGHSLVPLRLRRHFSALHASGYHCISLWKDLLPLNWAFWCAMSAAILLCQSLQYAWTTLWIFS